MWVPPFGKIVQGEGFGQEKATDFFATCKFRVLNGPIDITARGSKQAKEISSYKAAVNRFLAGDPDALTPWHGKKIAGIELITEKEILKSLAHKDLLPYSLYRSLSRGAA